MVVPYSALIIAAGASRRMGHPKALVEIRGYPLLDLHGRRYLQEGAEPVVGVLGYHSDRILAVMRDSEFQWVINPRPSRGMFSSLQAGCRWLLAQHLLSTQKWALFTPVDCPPVDPRSRQSLLEEVVRRESDRTHPVAVVPTFEQQDGHPVMFSPGLVQRVGGASSRNTLRSVLCHEEVHVIRVPVPDRTILLNLNTRSDVAEYSHRVK